MNRVVQKLQRRPSLARVQTARSTTGRADFRLAAGGLELIGVVPGIDAGSRAIRVTGFRPIVGRLRPMRTTCFAPPNDQEGIA